MLASASRIRGSRLTNGAAIADDKAVKLPLASHDIIDEEGVAARGHSVDRIVAAHDLAWQLAIRADRTVYTRTYTLDVGPLDSRAPLRPVVLHLS